MMPSIGTQHPAPGTSVLYLHGFASSPNSQKIQSLRVLLAPMGVELNTPDLNEPSFEKLDFDAMVERAGRSAGATPAAIVGSSLGSVVALEVVRRGLHAPLVLIAPGLGIRDQWLAKLPPGDPIEIFNFARGEKVPIHRAFFEQMSRVDIDSDPPPVPVTIFMGGKDETIPFDRVAAVWKSWESSGRLAPGSKFIEIPEGDHGLTAFVDRIAPEIHKASDILNKTP
jgi:pimeloyl-ACP methyl ester carboxylesterase